MERPDDEPAGDERREGFQNPVIHEGAEPDRIGDSNERADERATVRDPDEGSSPDTERD